MLRKVYRMETKDGTGMYMAKDIAHQRLSDSVRHPEPWSDSALAEKLANEGFVNGDAFDDWWFAFDDIKQLRHWIHEDDVLVALHNEGIYLAIYHVDDADVLVGHTQVMFADYTKKRQYNILKYFKLEN